MNEAEYHMKNCGDRGGCYPPEAEVDNSLQDLHNSSYDTKAEFTFDSALLGLFSSANILQIADVALRVVLILFWPCF